MATDRVPRIGIFVATHKPWPLPPGPLYRAIRLGGYRSDELPGSHSDADGDNIAALNPYYSELTGWYWIWKNVTDLDMIGLCHYRRYFFLHTGHSEFHKEKLYMEPTSANMDWLFSVRPAPLLAQVHRDGAVIVPRPASLDIPISQHYARCHRQSDWEAFLQAITETSPDHARQMHHFDTGRRICLYNMMIAPWTFFDDYMATLMAVLRKTESMIDSPDDPYQRRIPAFLAERFFTLHLMTTRPQRLEVPVVITDIKAY